MKSAFACLSEMSQIVGSQCDNGLARNSHTNSQEHDVAPSIHAGHISAISQFASFFGARRLNSTWESLFSKIGLWHRARPCKLNLGAGDVNAILQCCIVATSWQNEWPLPNSMTSSTSSNALRRGRVECDLGPGPSHRGSETNGTCKSRRGH